jgi:ATP-dependent Lhr-like helicase
LFLRENAEAWRSQDDAAEMTLSENARQTLETLRTRGASFSRELGDESALTELVAAGLVTSDGFAGLRALVDKRARADMAGRWSLCGAKSREAGSPSPEDAVETQARAFLRRYGVVFRRVLTRESNAAHWRDLARVLRRLEARGEIRGGRFVNGMSGEQFALPQAVERLREARREQSAGRLTVISAADPLNLTGIIDSGERIRATPGTRIAYRDGVAVSAMEGDYLRPLAEMDATLAMEAASALAGRRVPVASGFVGR